MSLRVPLLASVLCGWAVCLAANQRPAITRGTNEPLLFLPPVMEQALNKFDRDFVPRRWTDYPPLMWRPGCTITPTCADHLYKPDSRQAPFAVTGFFDGDDVMDVMIDGDSRSNGRRLVLTTGPAGVTVSEVERIERIPQAVAASRAEAGRWRNWDAGVHESLSFIRASTYRSDHEPDLLALTTDAVLVTHFDGDATVLYYRDGRWRRFIVARR